MESEANVLLTFKPQDDLITAEALVHVLMPSK